MPLRFPQCCIDFNKEIVTTLVRFFMDSQLNKNGGTLIFTTHHPELLDEYDRNDGICIVRNRNGITAENLSYILKRNDIKSDPNRAASLREKRQHMKRICA